jgi:hypothetical protein
VPQYEWRGAGRSCNTGRAYYAITAYAALVLQMVDWMEMRQNRQDKKTKKTGKSSRQHGMAACVDFCLHRPGLPF